MPMSDDWVSFSVLGRPVAAVRMTQRSKHCDERAKAYLAYKAYVGLVAKTCGLRPRSGDVAIEVIVYFRNNVVPDIDNALKAIMDGLNGVAWRDDRQVVSASAERRRSEDERAEVTIRYAARDRGHRSGDADEVR